MIKPNIALSFGALREKIIGSYHFSLPLSSQPNNPPIYFLSFFSLSFFYSPQNDPNQTYSKLGNCAFIALSIDLVECQPDTFRFFWLYDLAMPLKMFVRREGWLFEWEIFENFGSCSVWRWIMMCFECFFNSWCLGLYWMEMVQCIMREDCFA